MILSKDLFCFEAVLSLPLPWIPLLSILHVALTQAVHCLCLWIKASALERGRKTVVPEHSQAASEKQGWFMLADGGTYCLLNAVLSVRCQQVLCLSGHCQASSRCSPEFQYFIFARAAVFNPSASFAALGVCSETRSHLLLSWCQNF